jgi:DNA-binding GntR family transcriptional regulator
MATRPPTRTRAPASRAADKTDRNGKTPPRPRGAGMQTIYDTLRHDIIEMTIAPGEALDEVRLSQRFAMSRTPVREALVRLEAEGLVTSLSNRNTVVTPIDFARVPAYFDALVLMYRVTTRLAAERRTDADLAAIRRQQDAYARAADDGDVFAKIAINRDFHLAIAEAGRNPYYVDFFRRLLDEGRRLLRLYYSSYDDHQPYRHVHDEIIDAIVARDAALADRLAGEHALQVVSQIQTLLTPAIGATIAIASGEMGSPGEAPAKPEPAARSRRR